MGWADCGTDSKGRSIGYAFEATCDEEGCGVQIDRGLSYACGGMHGDSDQHNGECCEGYFCEKHRYGEPSYCMRCALVQLDHELSQDEGSLFGINATSGIKLSLKSSTAREGMISYMARHKRSALLDLLTWATLTDDEMQLVDTMLSREVCASCEGDSWFCSGGSA